MTPTTWSFQSYEISLYISTRMRYQKMRCQKFILTSQSFFPIIYWFVRTLSLACGSRIINPFEHSLKNSLQCFCTTNHKPYFRYRRGDTQRPARETLVARSRCPFEQGLLSPHPSCKRGKWNYQRGRSLIVSFHVSALRVFTLFTNSYRPKSFSWHLPIELQKVTEREARNKYVMASRCSFANVHWPIGSR